MFSSCLGLLLLAHTATCQFHEVGGGLGLTNTRTEISNFNLLNSGVGLWGFYRYNFNEVWVGRADLRFLQIGANDSHNSDWLSASRGASFSASVIELSANIEYNFLNYRQIRERFRWSPFLTAGVASFSPFTYSFSDPTGIYFDNGPSAFNFAIPFGLGIKYKLSQYLNLGATFIATKTFTDQLDGISMNTPTTIPLHYRGVDQSTNDWYNFLGFTISYTFYGLKCPPHQNDIQMPSYWQNDNGKSGK